MSEGVGASSSTTGTLRGHLGIVGAGIVGLAFAREIGRRHPGLTITVLEKESAVGRHQTSRNSGVVHSGLYYAPDSLKTQLCVRGVHLLRDYCDHNGLPYVECGKTVVATEQQEVAHLETLLERGTRNGVDGLRLLDRSELRTLEPHVAGVAALHSPRTAVVDFAAVARRLADDVREQGGLIVLDAAVEGLEHRASQVVARTTAGEHVFDLLVNCAGLHADRVAELSGDEVDPRIVPFRGDYWMLHPDRRDLITGHVYPVPDPRFPFLGIHLTRRIDGEVLIGPNAVLALAREGYRWRDVGIRDLQATLSWSGFRQLAKQHWRQGLAEVVRSISKRQFVAAAQRYVPDLRVEDVVRARSGVRAQALDRAGGLVDDFRFTYRGRVVNVRNAPSPAATSSLAIAEHIASTVERAAVVA